MHCPGLLFLPPSEPLAPPISPRLSSSLPALLPLLSSPSRSPYTPSNPSNATASAPAEKARLFHLHPTFHPFSYTPFSALSFLPSPISSSFSLFSDVYSLPLSLLFLATNATLCSRTERLFQPIPNDGVPRPRRSLFLPILFTSHVESSRRKPVLRRLLRRREGKEESRVGRDSPGGISSERKGPGEPTPDDGGDALSLIRARFHARGWNAGGLK